MLVDVRSAEPAEIHVDSMRLWRLLQNLVTNAIEAVESRTDGRIDIAAWVQGGYLLSDGGGQWPRSAGKRAGPICSSLSSREGKPRGTGLGLSIARNIVVAHGGTIDVKTAPGEGTTWLIELPQPAGVLESVLLDKR